MLSKYTIVSLPAAINFVDTARTYVMRKVLLGDAEKYHVSARDHIVHAHNALTDGLSKLEGLVDDPTRNEVLKHEAAKIVAEKTIATIEKSKAAIEDAGAALHREANETVHSHFQANPDRATIQSEIRVWINRTANTEGGTMIVRKAMNDNAEVAAVLYHSPAFLLGISDEIRLNMVVDGIEAHLPAAYEMMEQGTALTELAARYPAAARSVKVSFYTPAIADQAARRVEV